eukprot:3912728-Pyramimonas_sp.AAC.2
MAALFRYRITQPNRFSPASEEPGGRRVHEGDEEAEAEAKATTTRKRRDYGRAAELRNATGGTRPLSGPQEAPACTRSDRAPAMRRSSRNSEPPPNSK